MSTGVLAGQGLVRRFRDVVGLDGVSVTLEAGEMLAVAGPSGSGKTTLLAVLAGLDRPDGGNVVLDGKDLYSLPTAERTRYRAERLAFVFQNHNLLDALTARENVELAVRTIHPRDDARARASEALAKLGLEDLGDRRPFQLSLGQAQRVAVARALAVRPRVLIADEPTASLDGANGERLMDALEAMRATGCAILLASHDPRCLARATRQVRLVDGHLA